MNWDKQSVSKSFFNRTKQKEPKMYEDFYNIDGSILIAMKKCCEWLEKENPKDPVIVIIEQCDSFIHIRAYYDW